MSRAKRSTLTPAQARTLGWLSDPQRRPYRVSALRRFERPGFIWIVRRGPLVIGSYDSHEAAHAAVDRDIADPWTRRQAARS